MLNCVSLRFLFSVTVTRMRLFAR